MLNIIKLEVLVQVFKEKGLLKNSAKLTGKQLCTGASFIIKAQAECIKPNFYVHIHRHRYFPVKFAK